MDRTPSTWIACEECVFAFDGKADVGYCWEEEKYALKDSDIPQGVNWTFTSNSTFLCPHLAPDRGRQGAAIFRGRFTRKILGCRSLADQEKGKGSPASKMKPYYRP